MASWDEIGSPAEAIRVARRSPSSPPSVRPAPRGRTAGSIRLRTMAVTATPLGTTAGMASSVSATDISSGTLTSTRRARRRRNTAVCPARRLRGPARMRSSNVPGADRKAPICPVGGASTTKRS